jgi:non-ribosomal peptide synthetase component E (peptide arylation enzyme)
LGSGIPTVVVKSGVDGSGEIIGYMPDEVAPYEAPKRIDFADALPTGGVGEVLEREHRAMMKAEKE